MTQPREGEPLKAPGVAQTWNAADYAATARFVADLGQPVLDLLAPRPGERILDVGCGDGALTEKLVEAGATVVGADPAPDFVAARNRGGWTRRRCRSTASSTRSSPTRRCIGCAGPSS